MIELSDTPLRKAGLLVLAAASLWSVLLDAQEPSPIKSVRIATNRAFEVNNQRFFPLMAWLQDAGNFAAVKDCGMNTVAGYWPGSSNTRDVAEYLELVKEAGLYGVMPFDTRLRDHEALLAYIHGDEPDLPHQVSEAAITPAPQLRINRKTPLWKIVDGVTHSWSVLDPLEGASLTIRLEKPTTVTGLAVWLTVSPGLAVAKEVSFEADGKPLVRATLEARKGQQKITLPQPVTLRELKLTVGSTYAGEQVWGSIGEIEGFDAAGRNVLCAPPRLEPRSQPEEVLEHYRRIKAADSSRPVFMTLTGYFHPHFSKWSEAQRAALYPRYIAAADVVGYDIYPIYGWNKPEWIHLVHDATALLGRLAGPRPVYAWIETSRGGQYTGPLERQHEVRPEHIRAEIWMAVCRGATAIGYFTHVWKPSYRQFGVPEENRLALREINQQITRLAPAILADEPAARPTIHSPEGAKLDLMARAFEGDLYLFAVNYDERRLKTAASVSIAGLHAGRTIEVVDEDRTIRSVEGGFTDTFGPLAVHIYRVEL